MATLDVTQSPYNAVGDGATDDSDAIQSALNDAQDGDTVYLPANTYLLSTANTSTNDEDPLLVEQTGTLPNNVTVEGDGHDQSILKMDGGFTDTGNINMFRIEPGGGLTGWLVQKLGFDGNNPNQTQNDPRSIYNLTIGAPDTDSTTVDITIKNVDSFDALSTSMRTFSQGVTWERCSARNSKTDHGFGLNDGGVGTVLKHCYGADNNLYGVDSTGTTGPVIEDCVFESNGTTSGGAGGKLGDGGDTTTWRRVRFKDNGDRGFLTTGSGTGTCTFEDCIAEGHYREGFHLNSGYDYDVNGVMLADANNSSGNASGNVNIADTATANIEELRSYNAVNGNGFDNQVGETDLGTYLYDGNAGGAGDTANWTTATNDADQSELDQTIAPTASEVGAGSSTASEVLSGVGVPSLGSSVPSAGSSVPHSVPSTTVYPTTSSGWTNLSVPEPAHYWACEETSGTAFADQIGTQDMSLSGVTLGATGINGSNAGDYEAANDDSGQVTGADVNTAGYSFAFWLNFSSFEDFGRILQTGPPATDMTDGWDLMDWSGDGTLRLRHWSGGTDTMLFEATTVLTAGTWYFICGGSNGTKDDGILRIYDRDSTQGTNGLLESLTGTGTRATSASETLSVMDGGEAGENLGFTGIMDEILIWTTELTTTEFDTLYDQGSV